MKKLSIITDLDSAENFVGRFGEMPSENPIPEADKNKIMHMSLPIGEGTMLMGSDTAGEWGGKTTGKQHCTFRER
jgi:uncharacterized glyoxalase superfamily protein PhnB